MNPYARSRLHATALAFALVGALPLAAQDLTITNARIIGPNATVIERGSIVVRGGKILSGGGPGDGNITLRDHIDSGQINGPRIIPSGQVRLNQHTPESAREEIRKMAAAGIKFTGEIALTPVPGPTEQEMQVLRAIVDEGKKAGVMVQVHAVSTPAMVAAVSAGVPLLVHLPNKDFTSVEDAKKLAASGTKILATIGFGAPVFGVFANDNTPRFRDGKDWPQSIMGPNTASYIQMGDRLGTLEAGKIADIVLLDGDPLEGYWNWLKTKVTIKGGLVVVDKR
jgi:imidazolonepropionase-like amidohydrolase